MEPIHGIDRVAHKKTQLWCKLTSGVSIQSAPTGPLRFNEIKRRLEGITQKALTQCLRRLERNGLLTRHVVPVSPIAVEYKITPLGRSLEQPFKALYNWTLAKLPQVEDARRAFDQRQVV